MGGAELGREAPGHPRAAASLLPGGSGRSQAGASAGNRSPGRRGPRPAALRWGGHQSHSSRATGGVRWGSLGGCPFPRGGMPSRQLGKHSPLLRRGSELRSPAVLRLVCERGCAGMSVCARMCRLCAVVRALCAACAHAYIAVFAHTCRSVCAVCTSTCCVVCTCAVCARVCVLRLSALLRVSGRPCPRGGQGPGSTLLSSLCWCQTHSVPGVGALSGQWGPRPWVEQ